MQSTSDIRQPFMCQKEIAPDIVYAAGGTLLSPLDSFALSLSVIVNTFAGKPASLEGPMHQQHILARRGSLRHEDCGKKWVSESQTEGEGKALQGSLGAHRQRLCYGYGINSPKNSGDCR
jgi:hypothetical protein